MNGPPVVHNFEILKSRDTVLGVCVVSAMTCRSIEDHADLEEPSQDHIGHLR